MKWKSEMSERDIVQAILRNCNPRLASLFRGTVKDAGELIRIGTQIGRDFEESKRYWSQVNTADQKKKVQSTHCLQVGPPRTNTSIVQPFHNLALTGVKTVNIPIILQDRYCSAMIDTGSTLSLIQKSTWEQISKNEPYQPRGGQAFLLANGQQQTAIGRVTWKCEIQGCKMELTLYIMNDTDLTVPIILGMDLLMGSGLTLDFQRSKYIIPASEGRTEEAFPFLPHGPQATVNFYIALPIPLTSSETHLSIQKLVQQANTSFQFKTQLEKLMLQWPAICTHEIGHSNLVKHQILTTDEVPVRKRPYKVSVDKQQFIKFEINNLLTKKFVRPSTSPWAAPVVVVPKKDGSSRLCVDYRGLNAKTYLDAYPLPQIQDILESLHGAAIFSTLDLKSGYWQVEMAPDSIQKTVFVTSSGLYEFCHLPFGLKNATATFQRLMEHALRELKGKCCFIYIDDVVVFSKNEEDHLYHLQQVFHCLHKAGLTLNLSKCNFMQQTLTFLGHILSSSGIKTDPAKVEAVTFFPTPQSLKDVQRFLGLAGWYHRCIAHFSEKAAPLHALKQKNSTWL